MTLADYLADRDMTYAAFGRKIGTKHARTVERYAKGIQKPNAAMMAAVVRVTDGEVTPNDFFGISGKLVRAV
jgi:hypothetical protein